MHHTHAHIAIWFFNFLKTKCIINAVVKELLQIAMTMVILE